MKKKIIGVLLTCLFLATLFPAPLGQAYNSNYVSPLEMNHWPMFRYNPQRAGHSPARGPETNRTIWTYTTEGAVRSSAAIYNDMVYFGSYDGRIYCLNGNTGEKIWSVSISSTVIFSSPAVCYGYVYVGTADNYMYCLNATSGEIQWRYQTDESIFSSPCVENGYLYIGSNDDYVYCFDADPRDGIDEGVLDETGANYDLLWKTRTGDDIRSAPAVAYNRVYVGSYNGDVYCFDAVTGVKLWNVSLSEYWIFGSPAVVDTKVYIGTYDGNISCLNVYTGIEEWRINIHNKEVISSSPAVADGKLYIGSVYTGTGKLYCIDVQTHEEVWNYSTGPIKSSPAVAQGKVYVGSDDKKVYCFDVATGAKIWEYTTNGLLWSSPSIANGKLFIGTDSKTIYAFEDEDTNLPPDIPQIISGPQAAGQDIPLYFEIMTIDPDNDQVFYQIDWGDGNLTGWLGPYPSNESITINYSWVNQGTYQIRINSKDTYSEEQSGWSDPFVISIAPQIDIRNIKSGFIYLRYKTFNKSYAYIYVLDTLGASVVISDSVLCVDVAASEAVHQIKFVAYNPLWDDNLTVFDNTSEDGFIQNLEIPTGLWMLSTCAYDAEGHMIDVQSRDYLVYIIVNSGVQLNRHLNSLVKQRITERLLQK